MVWGCRSKFLLWAGCMAAMMLLLRRSVQGSVILFRFFQFGWFRGTPLERPTTTRGFVFQPIHRCVLRDSLWSLWPSYAELFGSRRTRSIAQRTPRHYYCRWWRSAKHQRGRKFLLWAGCMVAMMLLLRRSVQGSVTLF